MDKKIIDILEEICGTDEVRKDENIDLFDNGLIDSLGLIELLLKIEEELNIKIQPTEIKREDIATPNKIIEYLSQRG